MPAAVLDADPPVVPSYDLVVVFSPDEERGYTGVLHLTHNAAIRADGTATDGQRIEIPLAGRGGLNRCPAAVIDENEMTVRPLDVILLDGSASVDEDGPDGRPVQYEWVVIERPEGSTAQPVENIANPQEPADGGPADNRDTPTARFLWIWPGPMPSS